MVQETQPAKHNFAPELHSGITCCRQAPTSPLGSHRYLALPATRLLIQLEHIQVQDGTCLSTESRRFLLLSGMTFPSPSTKFLVMQSLRSCLECGEGLVGRSSSPWWCLCPLVSTGKRLRWAFCGAGGRQPAPICAAHAMPFIGALCHWDPAMTCAPHFNYFTSVPAPIAWNLSNFPREKSEQRICTLSLG